MRFPRPERPVEHVAAGMARAARDLTHGLMPHQREAVEAIAAHLSSSAVPSATCIAPTASGKTEIFVRLISGTAAPGEDGRVPTPTTLVLVPTRQLARQVSGRLRAALPDLRVGDLSGTPAAVSVGTYDGFMSLLARDDIAPGDVDHLVLDEAHRGLSKIRKRGIDRFVGTAAVCAYTASPSYSLAKSVHGLLGAGNVVVDIPLRRMVDEGVLPPIVNYVVRVRLEGDLPADPRTREAVLARAVAEAAFSFRRSHRDEMLGLALDGKSFVAYADTVAVAAAAASVFASADPRGRYECVHGGDPRAWQDEIVSGLLSGAVDGAFNAKLLSEGTDLPGVSLVLNLDPTASLVRQVQRCGRGLRPVREPGGRLRPAAIVDFVVQHGGRILGKPKFYFEAFGDPSIARVVEIRPKAVAALLRGVSGEGGDEGWAGEAVPLSAAAPEVETVSYLMAGRGKGLPAPPLAEPWTRRESLAQHGLDHPRVGLVWRRMVADVRSGRAPTAGGRVARFRLAEHLGRPVWAIHRDDLDLVRTEVPATPPVARKTAEWLSSRQVCARLGARWDDAALNEAWAALAEGRGLGDGRPVRFETRRSPGGDAPCLHASELPRLRLALDAGGGCGDGWLDEAQAMERIDLEPPYAPFSRAWALLAPGREGIRAATVAGVRRLHGDSLDGFLEAHGLAHLARGRTPRSWLTVAEAARRLGAGLPEAGAIRQRCLDVLRCLPPGVAGEADRDGLMVARKPWSGTDEIRVSPSSMPALATLLGRPWPIPSAEPGEWMSLPEAVASVPGDCRRRVREAWAAMAARAPMDAECASGLAWVRVGGRAELRVPAGLVPSLARFPLADDAAGSRWSTYPQVYRKARRSPGMLALLADAWDEVEAVAGPEPAHCPALGVTVALVRLDGVDSPCVRKDDVPAMLAGLAQRAPSPGRRDSVWLCPADAARRLGCG